MPKETTMTGEESLRLITDMIQKARAGRLHEDGIGAIMWGAVVGIAGIMHFAEQHFGFKTGFDWWLLALFALIPQIFIARSEARKKRVKSHEERALDTVWLVFGISIFCVVAYANIAPMMADRFLAERGVELLQRQADNGELKPFRMFPPSVPSLLMIIYAFPTMVTGIVLRFRPMIIGASLCYLFFLLSLFTTSPWDHLLAGLAGIFNWLIPGIILRRKYLSEKRAAHVPGS